MENFSFNKLHWDHSRYPQARVTRKVAKAICAQQGVHLPPLGYIVDVAETPRERFAVSNECDEFVVWKFFR